MRQTTSHIMMIRPKCFGYNDETAANNSFQSNETEMTEEDIHTKAQEEFDGFVEKLRSVGVNVIVVEDTATPNKPDAVFPNNWISFHEDGMIMTYPMYAKKRRIERREDIIEIIKAKYIVQKEYTFKHYEDEGLFLEGTGSLILDREHQVAYANLSQRTDLQLLEKWCVLKNYDKVHFLAKDRQGNDIYHTNVLMALAEDFVVVCLECIPHSKEKENLLLKFSKTNKEIVEISLAQVEQFAGNMLQVRNDKGETYLVMSTTAYESLTQIQKDQILNHTKILTGHIPTIEKFGGGSVRCMMAEIFLTTKA